MRFALKTLILAMMAMFIATLCMAQEAAPKKGEIFFEAHMEAYAQFYTDKNDKSRHPNDNSAIRMDDFRIKSGFTAGSVKVYGELRADEVDGVTFGDCYGQWNFIGPAYVKAGGYEQPWGKSRNSMSWIRDSFAHHTKRTANLEFGAENLGGMITIGVGVFKPTDYNAPDRSDMINALYAFVDFNKKISMVKLGVSLGLSTNGEAIGSLDNADNGVNASESIPMMFAEISTDFDFGLHFMANMALRLKEGDSVYPMKAAFHFELGYTINKFTAAALMDLASIENYPSSEPYGVSKTEAGLVLYYQATDYLKLKFNTQYGFQKQEMTLRVGFLWQARKIFDL
jgi:hypothetical protein